MKMKKARLALYITLACLLVASALGTAYAKYTSEHPMDSFNVYVTAGTIDLSVSGGESLVVVPGTYLELKDQLQPIVHLSKSSEDCYVFIKIEKSENVKDIIEINAREVSGIWTKLNEDGVYYMYVTKAANAQVDEDDPDNSRYVVFGNISRAISVSPTATKADLEKIKTYEAYGAECDKITITAYAVQKTHGIETVEAAWRALNPQS